MPDCLRSCGGQVGKDSSPVSCKPILGLAIEGSAPFPGRVMLWRLLQEYIESTFVSRGLYHDGLCVDLPQRCQEQLWSSDHNHLGLFPAQQASLPGQRGPYHNTAVPSSQACRCPGLLKDRHMHQLVRPIAKRIAH
jgi:hypothetical protein